MRFPGALSESGICFLIFGAMSALTGQDVEDGFRVFANDALLSVEERGFKWTVGDVMVSDVSLVILFDQVVDVLFTENPSVCVDVGLVDGWSEDGFGLTFGVNGFL
jgi:hypothetical protein